MAEKISEEWIKKVTFKSPISKAQLNHFREVFGERLLQEGEKYIVVQFRGGLEYLAFLVAMGEVKMIQLTTGIDIRDIEDTFTIPLEKDEHTSQD
jgi:hypothetical protein